MVERERREKISDTMKGLRSDNKLSYLEHDNDTATKVADMFNTNRRRLPLALAVTPWQI
jgi:hypothetical protein